MTNYTPQQEGWEKELSDGWDRAIIDWMSEETDKPSNVKALEYFTEKFKALLSRELEAQRAKIREEVKSFIDKHDDGLWSCREPFDTFLEGSSLKEE